jgi:hypothetical protein
MHSGDTSRNPFEYWLCNKKWKDCKIGMVWGICGRWMEEMKVREYGQWASYTYKKMYIFIIYIYIYTHTHTHTHTQNGVLLSHKEEWKFILHRKMKFLVSALSGMGRGL